MFTCHCLFWGVLISALKRGFIIISISVRLPWFRKMRNSYKCRLTVRYYEFYRDKNPANSVVGSLVVFCCDRPFQPETAFGWFCWIVPIGHFSNRFWLKRLITTWSCSIGIDPFRLLVYSWVEENLFRLKGLLNIDDYFNRKLLKKCSIGTGEFDFDTC